MVYITVSGESDFFQLRQIVITVEISVSSLHAINFYGHVIVCIVAIHSSYFICDQCLQSDLKYYNNRHNKWPN